MANTKSALKRVRQTKVRTSLNRALKSRVKLTRKNALAAYEAGDKAAAQEAFNLFASAADKAAKSGAMHKGTASRIKGRMAVRLNGAGAQA
ncbi:MAG: 30S ribosomal protein S20 [Verrucomicrobiales bacterium]|jgi:small subunit ribosomal protein S20|nr:30S ribosomal protein S20 [Verrucomicrobiales bacterium]MBP9222885.1 30S ribosomal protein S20 [Verrucomicrobiales bacterium]HQZ26774.1 30S ribosomal protein S20 [Verrucomicrobiales bacterium]